MRELNLLCIKFKHKVRKYRSYKGEIGKIANNMLNRNFTANKPNKIWLTDITEFKLPNTNRKIYLSPILDLYNSEIISFTIGFNPTIELTNKALDLALKGKKDLNELIIHSDQGFHYQHSSWVNKLEQLNITQSMSRKGNCLDNSPMENFFGVMKQEMFYGEQFTSIDDLIKEIKDYIIWYNQYRIKKKLKGLSPVNYRQQSA